ALASVSSPTRRSSVLFLRTQLGVAGHDLELLDMDRGEDVIGNDALRQEDGVLVVIAIPRHERDEHVAAERQIAKLGRRTVGDDRSEEHTSELQSRENL